MTVRVALVDDEELVRTGLRAIIEAEADLTVVGEAADGADVIGLMRLRPDVVLMDVRMPRSTGSRPPGTSWTPSASHPGSWW